ncbi:MAG TPA: cytochrome c [Acidimicrobiales bacterium]
MTEVPEHLLKRSRDRRSALGLGDGDDGGGGDAAAAAPADEPAGGAVQAAAATAAAAPAAATPATPEPAEPEFVPPYVEAAITRKKIPFWAMPVLAFLPVWAIIYVGGLAEADTGEPSQLELGAQIYQASCQSCHGATGAGGVGRPLSNGDVVKTFPDLLGHLEFVYHGSAKTGPKDTPYGDPNREDGQHLTLSYNGNPMPEFGESLTGAELLAVVRYEREGLSGAEIAPEQLDTDENMLWPNGEPMVDASGNLINPDGEPLFDADGILTLDPNYAEPAAGSG